MPPIELEIRNCKGKSDHCEVWTASGDYVGFVSLTGDRVRVQRCQVCKLANYAPAVMGGVCVWCGWDAAEEALRKTLEAKAFPEFLKRHEFVVLECVKRSREESSEEYAARTGERLHSVEDGLAGGYLG